MKKEIMDKFSNELAATLGENYDLHWGTDKKGVVCGWCKLAHAEDICLVAEVVASFQGRVMTISPLLTADHEKMRHMEIKYHFYFAGVNCTVSGTLPDVLKKISSITPILKSADWHEREMQELYNIELQGHPNPQRLFLDESIRMTDQTMIPLSAALNGASTNTLWEKIMRSGREEANTRE